MANWYFYLLSTIFIILGSNNGNAQEDSTQVIELKKEVRNKMEFAGVFKSAIGVELGGKSGLVGVNYDLLFSRHVRMGLGLGYAGAGAELKFFPFGGVKRQKIRFTAGIRANYMAFPNETKKMFYSAPLGIFYAGLNRVNYEFDIGPLYQNTFDQPGLEEGISDRFNYVWFSVKLSYRFSFYAMRRARELARED